MFLNVTINNRVNAKIGTVSLAELQLIRRSVSKSNGEAQLSAWNAEAEQLTATSSAVENLPQFREVYTSNNDGTFTVVATTEYSSEGYAMIAADRANKILSVTVESPVTSVPNNPNGSPGTPTVEYNPLTGAFSFGIPVGAVGQGIIPFGNATVAEINALDTLTLTPGTVFIMTDAGTITNGIVPVVVAIDDWLGWGTNGSFTNLGKLEGPTGPAGPTGPQGIPGDQGIQGDQGVQGNAGPQGPTGSTGSIGPDGPDGVAGPTGPAGADSTVPGPTGPDGAVGPIGPIGPDGADSTVPGPTGPIGPDGAEGIQGPAGTGLIFSGYDTVVNILAKVSTVLGEAWTASDTGTDSQGTPVAIDDVLVAQGAIGSTVWHSIGAIQGPTGATGPTGADSVVPGPIGPDGADSVVPGPTGPTGPIGPDGADSVVPGPTGPIGPDGADSVVPGPTGADGGIGPAGPTGADGPASVVPGPTGPAGADGTDGLQGVPGADGADSVVPGPTGPAGADGPTAVSSDAGNAAKLGTDSLILVDDRTLSTPEVIANGNVTWAGLPLDETTTPMLSSLSLIGSAIQASIYPDGVIIGSTSNGLFKMYPDGRLECSNYDVSFTGPNLPAGAIFFGVPGDFLFCKAFVGDYVCVGSSNNTEGAIWVATFNYTALKCSVNSFYYLAYAGSVPLSYIAHGNWK